MYGKTMSISDDLMWRYYELLTDVTADKIAAMKGRVRAGELHPMHAKKELASQIVADFHSLEAARQAEIDWAKQFQKDEVPENVEHVQVLLAEVAGKDGTVKLDKLVARCGMAESVSDALRKVKAKAVRVDNEVHVNQLLRVETGKEFTLRVGRLIKRVTLA
jgi:tyrosyl-tRNA synthetase